MTYTTLLPCPICGESKGYYLDEGSTYRWWSVKCDSCGQEVAEARATYPAETTPRTANADAAWNDAGKHAQALRDTIKHQDAELRRLSAEVRNSHEAWAALSEHAEKLRAEIEALRRGEFVCKKCGLRKDADASGPVPF